MMYRHQLALEVYGSSRFGRKAWKWGCLKTKLHQLIVVGRLRTVIAEANNHSNYNINIDSSTSSIVVDLNPIQHQRVL
jgi:hypothetical protein